MTKSTRATCKYCGHEFGKQGIISHEEKCLYGPSGERIRAFLREYTETHGCPSTREWDRLEERQVRGFPTFQYMTQTFGSWKAFIEWCGLEHERINYTSARRAQQANNPTRRCYDDSIADHRRKVAEAEAYYSQPQLIDRGVKRLYDPLRACYYTAQVWEWR